MGIAGFRFPRLGPTRERETPTIRIVGTQMSCQCQNEAGDKGGFHQLSPQCKSSRDPRIPFDFDFIMDFVYMGGDKGGISGWKLAKLER